MKRFTTLFIFALTVLVAAFSGCKLFQHKTDPQQGLDNFVMLLKTNLDKMPRTYAQAQRRTYRVEVDRTKRAILIIDEKSRQTEDMVLLPDGYEITLSRPVMYGPNGKLLGSESVKVTVKDTNADLSESFTIE